MEERGKLQQRLAEEEQGGANGAGQPSKDGAEAEVLQQDPLDAFMSDMTVQLEQSKVNSAFDTFPSFQEYRFY